MTCKFNKKSHYLFFWKQLSRVFKEVISVFSSPISIDLLNRRNAFSIKTNVLTALLFKIQQRQHQTHVGYMGAVMDEFNAINADRYSAAKLVLIV